MSMPHVVPTTHILLQEATAVYTMPSTGYLSSVSDLQIKQQLEDFIDEVEYKLEHKLPLVRRKVSTQCRRAMTRTSRACP
jgi:hypothetical protein